MSSAAKITENQYWDNFEVTKEDLDFINNHLFELETPHSSIQLLEALIINRINIVKKTLAKKKAEQGRIYIPKESYKTGEPIQFSALNWQAGVVSSIREGVNPEYSPFKVIDVQFPAGEIRSFAAEYEDHPLNDPQDTLAGLDYLDKDFVLENYAPRLLETFEAALMHNDDLVRTAGAWFPRALLLDINVGHLNLVEAILDMAGGGPLTPPELMAQLDLPVDVSASLVEFSLNLALQEDPRFDEVGPSGDVLWFLEKLEPENVRKVPVFLQYVNETVDRSLFDVQMLRSETQLDDENTPQASPHSIENEVKVTLTYPHWRAGSLPLSQRTDHLFPIALESPRIKFQFVDSETQTPFPGWVVRPHKYVVGLREWYLSNGVVPGSVITIHKSNPAGDVIINANNRRPTKEWVRTALVGADDGLVLALLKQQISTEYEERMTTVIPDVESLDVIWNLTVKQKNNSTQAMLRIAKELTKLNPQGHIHAEELYAAVNLIKRCPIELVFHHLINNPAFNHVGDLYYRLNEGSEQE
jgi:hypothetical protein